MDCDLLIVGAGPAGSVAGIEAAGRGIKTTIIDKENFPREKPCGGGLTANSVDFLIENGLMGLVQELENYSFSGYKIYSSDQRVVSAPLKSRNKAKEGYVIKRFDFDHSLVKKAVSSGCDFIPKAKAESLSQNNGSVTVSTAKGRIKARAVIVADGSGVSLTKKILSSVYPAETLAAMAFFKNVKYQADDLLFFMDRDIGYGYGWVFLYPDGRANIGAGADVRMLRKKKQTVRDVFDEFIKREPICSIIGEGERETKVRSYPLRMAYPKATLRKGNVLFAGDAANLVYPLTGEGIPYAMLSGKLAAQTAAKAIKADDISLLEDYRTQMNKEFKDFKLAWFLKKNLGKPWFQDLLFRTATKDKYLSDTAIAILENTVSCRVIFSPKVLLRLLTKGLTPSGNNGSKT